MSYLITVKTLYGLEKVLAEEIDALGGEEIDIQNRAVQFIGDDELLYKSNLYLRTALRVVKPIRTVRAYNYKQLNRKIQSVEWDNYINVDQTFAIHATTHSEVFRHSKYVALRTKDAIVDQFRDKYGKRPDVDTDDPDIQIYVHVSDKNCTLSLDSSGDSLDKRGYRLQKNVAPINEVLASGLLMLAGWKGDTNFLDPMCGSGTIPIEACMIAANLPPGMNREFAFQKWNDFDQDLWNSVKEGAKHSIRQPDHEITGSDIDDDSIEAAVENAKRAGVSRWIEFRNEDFVNQSKASFSEGVLFMNPPYGKRISEQEIISFYKSIGDKLKSEFNGWNAWIISANMEAMKFVGLRPSEKIKLFNGSLECRLQHYELYSGSKKSKHKQQT